MAKAKMVHGYAEPKFEHDCDQCRFLGRLDGEDLYVCQGGYTRRFGDEPHANGSLGELTPPGTPYAFAAALQERDLPPAEYRTVFR